jgi:glycosyltransferase involved in cell wall biosynthesis
MQNFTTQKKVLFLITKSNWGGAQRYVFDLATNLDPLAFQSIVAFGGNGELADKLTEAGIKTISLKSLVRDISAIKELRAIFELIAIIHRERPDVLHINSSKAGLYGALFGRLLRVPRIIFTSHGWAFNEARPWWQQLLFKTLHWLTVLLSHETIAVSATLKNQLSWPGAASRMRVIKLGRSLPEFKTKEDARQLLEMQVTTTDHGLIDFHEDTWIGTIAELHPIKNLAVAIDAVASLIHIFPSLRYVIIGEGQERAQLTAQIYHLGLEEHVFLVGALPEAARFLKAFDLFVLPSTSEGAGYVLLEAGLASVPIVATNVGGIPELITNGQTGSLVPPDAVDALTIAIRELLENADRQTEYITTLLPICTSYTIEKMVAETAQIYNS